MDISKLQSALSDTLKGDAFDLPGTALGPDMGQVSGLFDRLFSQPSLRLDKADLHATGDATTVRGILACLPRPPYDFLNGMGVVAVFSLDLAGTPQIELSFSPATTNFGLADALPLSRNGAFSAFAWSEARFVIATQATVTLPGDFPARYNFSPNSTEVVAGLQRGMTFEATVAYAGSDLGMELLVGRDKIRVSGPIEWHRDAPRFDIASATLGSREFEGFSLPISLHFVGILIELLPLPPDQVGVQPASLAVLAGILERRASEGKMLEIPFAIGIFSDPPGQVTLLGRFGQASQLALDELASLLGVSSLDSQKPAGNLPPLTGLALQTVALTVNMAQRRLVMASAEVSYAPPDGPWDPFGNKLLTFERLAATFYAVGPLSSPSLSASIDAKGTLCGGELDARIALPDLEFCCELQEGSVINLSPILAEVFGASFKILCTELRLLGNPLQKYYRFQAAVSGDQSWGFEAGGAKFALTGVGFDLTCQSGQYSGEVVATLVVAGTDLHLSAQYPGSGLGWEFNGGTDPGQTIELGELVADTAKLFGAEVSTPEPKIEISRLEMMLKTQSMDFGFSCEGQISMLDGTVDIGIDVGRTCDDPDHPQTTSKVFAGYLRIGPSTFEVDFTASPEGKSLLFKWIDTDEPLTFEHMAVWCGYEMPALPENLDLALTAAEFRYDFGNHSLALAATSKNYGQILFATFLPEAPSPNKTRIYLFELDVPLGVDLSRLPLVGDHLRTEWAITIEDLQVLVSTADQAADSDMKASNFLAEALGLPPLMPTSLGKGFTFAAKLQIGSDSQTFILPLSGGDTATPAPKLAPGIAVAPTPTPADPRKPVAHSPAPASGDIQWFKIDRSFGPVHLGRVGLQYRDSELRFLLDGSLGMGGIALSLIGLSVGSPIKAFKPDFQLQGLGLSADSGAVKIAGTFLRNHVAGPPVYDEYAGQATIATAKFTLGAIGAYADFEGQPSLFVYAVLDMPLGGPAFFFVTGLAAGFGYNRTLRLPAIDQVAQFPLVQEAMGASQSTDLPGELARLRDYIPPSTGDEFFCLGVRFTSFKMVDSFALLALKLGSRVEIDLLGLSTLVVPTPEAGVAKDPLAVVQLALLATFIPDAGFLGVTAQLTASSYIISRDCHLTGGFAFYSWFGTEHPGDFVLTVGGYHPNYNPPTHYPQVPRLALNWQVTPELSIKADAYFALVPSTLMAGGHMQMLWQSGSLQAWFSAGADFLIAWKPYHYEAHIYVDIGVSYTFSFFGRHTISVDVGADLQVWGPDFAGVATVHLWVIDFTVDFGPAASTSRTAIGWESFRTMLPAQPLSIAVQAGLVRKGAGGSDPSIVDLGVINPKQFVLNIESAIPISGVQGVPITAGPPFGIAPMDVAQADSPLVLTFESENAPRWTSTPVKKPKPAALWGTGGLNGTGSEMTPALLCGCTLSAPAPAEPDHTPSISRQALGFEDAIVVDAFRAAAPGVWKAGVPKALPSAKGLPAFDDWQSDDVDANYRGDLLLISR